MHLWRSPARGAAVTRKLLTPASWVFRAGGVLRAAYHARRVRAFPVPSVVVGSIQAGGAGKTPLAGWVAHWYLARGVRPGILLRDYGADESVVHRLAVPDAVIETGADRHAAARRAVARGAGVLVLDDAFQRHDLEPTVSLALVSAELAEASPASLPAGPWREPWDALRRADGVIVTRKSADSGAVSRVIARLREIGVDPLAVLELALGGLHRLRTSEPVPLDTLRGATVALSAGIADPEALAGQLEQRGARVRRLSRRDHHRYRMRDLREIVRVTAEVDYVVVTAKDAVKLADRWPGGVPEPLVAELALGWQTGRSAVEHALVRALPRGTHDVERKRSSMRVA